MTATVIFADDPPLSPDALDERADRVAAGLADLGLGEGDVVAVMLRNDVPWIETMLAARRLGAYYAPINWHLKGAEAGYILADCGARALVVHADLLAELEGHVPAGVTVLAVPTPPALAAAYGLASAPLPPGVEDWHLWRDRQPARAWPDRPPRGMMAYTSGTTGRPKGVRRRPATPELGQRMAESLMLAFGLRPGVRTCVTAPIYHAAPNLQANNGVQLAELLVIEPRFEALRLIELVERHRLDHLYLAPIMLVRLLRLSPQERQRHDLSSLRHVVTTGAPCPAEVKRAIIDWWGPILHETYAGSEAAFVTVCNSEEWLARPGTVGRPLPHVELRLFDDDGTPTPPGEVGTIYIRTAAAPEFTYNNMDEERRAIDRDGFITMGDMGRFDGDGYLYISDRKRDMVISGGVNIYPAEIEMVLITMPGVQDCAVFGIPDPEYGEALAAAVQPLPGRQLDAAAVQAFLRERIAGFKVPRLVTFHEALPREDSGKIFKRRLRAPYWEAAGRSI